jgi:hypothetical protein
MISSAAFYDLFLRTDFFFAAPLVPSLREPAVFLAPYLPGADFFAAAFLTTFFADFFLELADFFRRQLRSGLPRLR